MKPNDLKLCIEALKALREEMHQEMNTSVAGKLEEVILRLEDLLEAGEQDVDVPIETRLEALRVLADVLQVVTNVSDLIRQWASML